MITRHFRKIAILAAILAIFLAACGPQETETPEPTEEVVEATEEVVEATEEVVEATEEVVEATEEVVEATEEVVEATEEVVEATEEVVEATEEVVEATEEVVEATEEVVEATEEVVEATEEVVEATEEAMDMEATEEAMDDMDMSDGAVVTYDDEAGFTFDYPEGYEPTVNADGSVISLAMGEQRLIVVSPTGWSNVVIGEQEGSLDEQLAFFVERLGYTAGESSDMMMSDASINVEVPRRGLVGFANLSDLDNGNYAVVIELGPDADSIPGADGAIISGSMVMEVVQAEPVAVGDTIAASIDAGQRSSYELTLADGETVNIYLNGLDGLDTYLRVYDADGTLIAENDDLNGVSSGLEGFSVAGGGVVTVEVGTYADGEAGDYELVVEVAAAEEDAEAEATEEPMGDAEATEEPMDMEATEEAATDDMDMSDGAVVTYDDEAGFTFDYPEGYEPTVNADGSVISLDMGEQRLIVVSPTGWSNVVIGEQEGSLDEQLVFFVERLGYTAGESSDMMMSDASINVEVPRRGLVGFANLSDLDNGNYAVVIELGPDADSIPGADGAVISGSMVMEVVQAEPVAVGDTIAASIDAGQRSSYELTLADGETVNIYLNGLDGLDTYLRVYDADGTLIAENDDLNGVSSGLEGFSVAGGGVVTVEVGTYADGEAGDYELVVEVAASEEAADDEEAMDMEESSLTIVGLALQNENLSTLLVAVQRGGYLPTLNGEGSFTVFAPSNEAFEAALEELGLTADELLANEELLSSILTYHVVEGAVLSGDLEDGAEVTTLNGAVLTVGVSDEGITLTDGQGNTYNVVTADVAASNGVVHIIDGVLMPASE